MFEPRPFLDSKAFLILVMLCASWGVQQVMVKVALPTFPPITQTALRSGIAGIVMLVVALRRPKAGLLVRYGTLKWGLLLGSVFAAEFAVLNIGLQWTDASRASVLFYTSPLMVALAAQWLLPHERLAPVQWVGLVVTFLGVVVVMNSKAASSSESRLLGDGLVLLAAAGWTTSTMLIKTTPLARISPEKILVYQLVVSAILLGVAALMFGEHITWPPAPIALASVAMQAIWVASFTYVLWFAMLAAYPASRLQGATSMTPLFGVLAAVVFLGEPLRPSFGVAVALVIAGLLLLNLGPVLFRRRG
ncbi:DMT family transporter [Segnochrobactrum spirostomi]|nr:DMT family transporter [Segnochrobactrum spirostomi]